MTDLIAELVEVVRKMRAFEQMDGTAKQLDSAVGDASHAAYMLINRHHAEIEAMARDAARYQTLKDADVWSDEVWHAIDERDSDGLDEALDAMHNSAREVGE